MPPLCLHLPKLASGAHLTHRPPVVSSSGYGFDDDQTITKSIPGLSRRRLWSLIQGHNVRLFAAGHLHYYKTWQTQGITMIAAPPLLRRAGDWVSTDGVDGNGIVEYTFVGESVSFQRVVLADVELIEPLPKAISDWSLRPLKI